MDHEILSAGLGPELEGWDWFAVQLDDRTELMVFLLRNRDGSIDPYSAGTFIDAAGETTHLSSNDFSVEETDHWVSPQTNARYPVAWRLNVVTMDLTMGIRAMIPASELILNATDVTYWEGAVRAEGRRGETPIAGRGYVEMSGRDQPFEGI